MFSQQLFDVNFTFCVCNCRFVEEIEARGTEKSMCGCQNELTLNSSGVWLEMSHSRHPLHLSE